MMLGVILQTAYGTVFVLYTHYRCTMYLYLLWLIVFPEWPDQGSSGDPPRHGETDPIGE